MSAPTLKPQANLLKVGPARQLTADDMKQDMRKRGPAYSISNLSKRGVKPFYSTIGVAKYREYKTQVGAKPVGKRSTSGTTATVKPLAQANVVGPDFDGSDDIDFSVPPDTHGAAGADEFVEVTNTHIDIYQKSDPTIHTTIELPAFFGYSNAPLSDPRVVYDRWWNRWVITVMGIPESPTVQNHFIAISMSPSALGGYWLYAFNVTFTPGDLWDYPQLGMDQDAVIITANIFDASFNSKGADMLSIAKARLYNGWGWEVPVFTNLVGTLAPPIVLDQNATTFLVVAPVNSNALQLYALQNSSTQPSLSGPINVPVNAYTAPLPSPQPGTSDPANLIDTGDGRFVNASTQTGDFLWQVHSVDVGGLPTPVYYQINTVTNSVAQSGQFFASASSYDFNASITASSENDAFVTWTSIDPQNGTNAQVRFSGCDHNDGPCVISAGTALFTSSTFLADDFDPNFGMQRWGDYSAVTVDPLNDRQAWLINEKIDANQDWGSHISNIGF